MHSFRMLCVVFLQVFLLVRCASPKVQFLVDFFKGKTQPILLDVCWKKSDLVGFFYGVATKKVAFTSGGDLFKLDSLFVVVDLINCDKSQGIFNEVHQHSWLILIDANTHDFSKIVQKLPLLPSSEFILGLFERERIKLVQPYKRANSSTLIWEDYGYWHQNTGLVVTRVEKTTAVRRHNLGKAPLKILVEITHNDTLKNLENFKNSKIDANTKQDWGSIGPLLDYCNVTYNLIKFGGEEQEQFDLIATSLMITESNLDRYDFIKMIHPRRIKFFLKKPPISYVKDVFVGAFQYKVWLSMVVILVIFGCALYVILNIADDHQKCSPSDVIMVLLEAVCKQGTATNPKSISGRATLYLLFLAFVFLSTAYSANIVVQLQSTKAAKDIQELLSYRIEFGDTTNGYYKNYSKKFQVDTIESVYDVPSGLERVRMGLFAFRVEMHHAHEHILEKFHDYDVCGLQEISNSKNEFDGYVAIPKRSPYKEIFKIGLLRVDECGLQTRSIRRFHSIPKCFNKAVNFNNAGVIDCYLALMVMVFGTILSVIVLKVELMIHKRNRNVSEAKNM